MGEIDSRYIVLKYYAIPGTASNPSFSIVIVERVKYKSVREIATRKQGDTRRERGEKIIECTLHSKSITIPGLFYDDIPVYFFMNNPKRYLYG